MGAMLRPSLVAIALVVAQFAAPNARADDPSPRELARRKAKAIAYFSELWRLGKYGEGSAGMPETERERLSARFDEAPLLSDEKFDEELRARAGKYADLINAVDRARPLERAPKPKGDELLDRLEALEWSSRLKPWYEAVERAAAFEEETLMIAFKHRSNRERNLEQSLSALNYRQELKYLLPMFGGMAIITLIKNWRVEPHGWFSFVPQPFFTPVLTVMSVGTAMAVFPLILRFYGYVIGPAFKALARRLDSRERVRAPSVLDVFWEELWKQKQLGPEGVLFRRKECRLLLRSKSVTHLPVDMRKLGQAPVKE
jgi:hypothetical protein